MDVNNVRQRSKIRNRQFYLELNTCNRELRRQKSTPIFRNSPECGLKSFPGSSSVSEKNSPGNSSTPSPEQNENMEVFDAQNSSSKDSSSIGTTGAISRLPSTITERSAIPRFKSIGLDGNSTITEEVEVCEIEVKRAVVFHPESEDVYRMASKPKGLALVINNKHFKCLEPDRNGSEKDFALTIQLLEGLEFEVEPHEDLETEQMSFVLETFAAKCSTRRDINSCVVAISTHGFGHYGIQGTDGNFLHLDHDIIPLFNNQYCDGLQGKPKLFIIQACRGEQIDDGNDVVDGTGVAPSPGAEKMPSFSDVMIIQSTIPGYVSNRNPHHGSWLIQSLVKIFAEHACSMDIDAMLRRVTRKVMTLKTVDAEMQSPEIILRGWRKQLYFNPGLYEDDTSKQESFDAMLNWHLRHAESVEGPPPLSGIVPRSTVKRGPGGTFWKSAKFGGTPPHPVICRLQYRTPPPKGDYVPYRGSLPLWVKVPLSCKPRKRLRTELDEMMQVWTINTSGASTLKKRYTLLLALDQAYRFIQPPPDVHYRRTSTYTYPYRQPTNLDRPEQVAPVDISTWELSAQIPV